ncbi:AbrB family transcriptional regulator [Brevibacillus dissolubilis]|uniref:AbrB family transcriptional regulator n=1 Tax=Brevibacillus dissolubilis TaxID=1844116 RepID=UPI001116A338|nr:AbrB family transcriptional regulator [Brevibacillus dissolubilis]
MRTRSSQSPWLRGVETYLVALVGALLFTWLNVPLSWMLGSITAVMIWRGMTKRPLYAPPLLRTISFLFLGYMLGTSFTRDTAWQILIQAPYMLLITVTVVVLSVSMGYWVAKKSGINPVTGVFGSIPGGLSHIVLLSEEEEDADTTVVTFMQTIRLFAVIFIVPLLTVHGIGGLAEGLVSGLGAGTLHTEAGSAVTTATAATTDAGTVPELRSMIPFWSQLLLFLIVVPIGTWLAHRINMPAALITGPLLTTALTIIMTNIPAPPLPPLLIIISQVMVGTYLGLTLKINNLKQFGKVGTLTTLSNIVLLLVSVVIAILLSSLHHISLPTAFLSTAPGGVAEMGITAHTVHADLSIVSSYQLFRVFFIMFVVPWVLRKWLVRQKAGKRSLP